jgi:hypothetical protein
MESARDRNGTVVEVGTRVRVLKIRPSVLAPLTTDEVVRVQSMEGVVFEVYEIDKWRCVWVTKWWHVADGKSFSHSLSLASEEMEVVSRVQTHDA